MSIFAEEDLTCDAFLGGKLSLWQPRKGYRAGVDPVLLAASVPAKAGQSVLDVGCGAGAAALCLGTRVPGLDLVGLERHEGYAALAVRNGAALGFEVVTGDVGDMPRALKERAFDHVISNPPYYDRARGTASGDTNREVALGEDVRLDDWIKASTKRLKPRGYLHLVLKADRLADALAGMSGRVGSVEICPIHPRQGRPAELILLRGRKDGRAKLKLNSPLVTHEGACHPGDRENYTKLISAVLREGSDLIY